MRSNAPRATAVLPRAFEVGYTPARMDRARRSWLSVGLAFAGVGCSGAGPGAVEATVTDGSIGVLEVERTDGSREGGQRTALSAAFARYRGLDTGEVLGLVGHRLSGSLESCEFTAEGEALAHGEGEVELLDVGGIRVRLAGAELTLAPRAFPDLASVMAGVFYAGDAQLVAPRAELDEYTFDAAGSFEVPAFDAVVPAPSGLAEVRIGDAWLAEGVALDRETGFELAWAAGDADDRVEVELRAHGDVLRCVARDDGATRIDAEALAPLAPDPEATLVVRRVRIVPLDISGLDEAFARVSVARAVSAALD